MKIAFLTHSGLELFCSRELKAKYNISSVISPSVCVTDDIDWAEIAHAVYGLQSPIRMGLYLTDFRFIDLDDLRTRFARIDFKDFLPNTPRLSKECIRRGTHDFSSDDVKRAFELPGMEIDYKNPTSQILIFIIDNHCYVSLDLIGSDASKRLYKIFHHPASIKGTLAYSLLEFAGYNESMTVIDPFLGSGTILIEAALSTLPMSQWFFHPKLLCAHIPQWRDQGLIRTTRPLNLFGYDAGMKSVNAARKNAKLAGVDKSITISKVDIEWLDTKHKEASVDLIITHPPEQSKHRNPKDIDKVHIELYHQASYILKEGAHLVAFLRKPKEFVTHAKGFSIVDQLDFTYGDELVTFLKLQK